MIRNAVIHLAGEQPLLVDLDQSPQPSDLALICSNVRYIDGKKPTFIDHTESTFVFPMAFVRFLEIPPPDIRGDRPMLSAGPIESNDEDIPDLEPDEEFLQRIRDA